MLSRTDAASWAKENFQTGLLREVKIKCVTDKWTTLWPKTGALCYSYAWRMVPWSELCGGCFPWVIRHLLPLSSIQAFNLHLHLKGCPMGDLLDKLPFWTDKRSWKKLSFPKLPNLFYNKILQKWKDWGVVRFYSSALQNGSMEKYTQMHM